MNLIQIVIFFDSGSLSYSQSVVISSYLDILLKSFCQLLSSSLFLCFFTCIEIMKRHIKLDLFSFLTLFCPGIFSSCYLVRAIGLFPHFPLFFYNLQISTELLLLCTSTELLPAVDHSDGQRRAVELLFRQLWIKNIIIFIIIV